MTDNLRRIYLPLYGYVWVEPKRIVYKVVKEEDDRMVSTNAKGPAKLEYEYGVKTTGFGIPNALETGIFCFKDWSSAEKWSNITSNSKVLHCLGGPVMEDALVGDWYRIQTCSSQLALVEFFTSSCRSLSNWREHYHNDLQNSGLLPKGTVIVEWVVPII